MNSQDLDFFLEQLSSIKSERIYEVPTEYIERVRYIPKGLSPKPGFFQFSYTPYLIEPFNLLASDSGVQEIAFMKSAQIGYTVGMIENGILYHIGSDSKYQQFVTADQSLAKETVKERIDPMIDNAGLRHLIFSQSKRKGSKLTGDTLVHKQYPGGALSVVGARNPDAFRGKTRQVSFLDEIDTFSDDPTEGSKLGIIRNRSNAFSETRKIIYGSTPLIEQTSQIYKLYKMGDMRQYHVPCPRCGEMIVLHWRIKNDNGVDCGIVFDVKDNLPVYETVAYKCQACEETFKNDEKVFFLLGGKGEWRPTAVSKVPRFRSYWINALYSPPGMFSWEQLVQDWARAWDFERNRVKDIDAMKEFYNTKRGIPWEEKGTQLKYEKVVTLKRTGFLTGKIPEDKMIADAGSEAMIVIASCDVQGDCIWVDVKAYTAGGQSWTLEFFDLPGNPQKSDDPIWDKLDDFIVNTRYKSESGRTYWIEVTFIDSGWKSENVYEFCRRFASGVFPVKGEESLKDKLVYVPMAKTTLERAGVVAAYKINTTLLKNRMQYYMGSLQWQTGEQQPEFYCNFPEDLKDDYFKMLEAEEKVIVKNKQTGQYIKTVWRNTHELPNHAADTFCYNLAALHLVADRVCRENLGIDHLNWSAFWEACKDGLFYYYD